MRGPCPLSPDTSLTRRLWIVPLLPVALLAGGCGIGRFGLPGADELYREARANALHASSGAVRGTVTQGGRISTLEWSGSGDGAHYRQTLTTPGVGEVVTIRSGGETYVKAPKAWYAAHPWGADVPEEAYDAFVRLDHADVGQALTLRSLVEQTLPGESLPRMERLSAKVVEVKVNGRATYRVTFGGDEMIDVDSQTRRLVRLRGSGSESAQTYDVTFSSWGAVSPVDAPETVN